MVTRKPRSVVSLLLIGLIAAVLFAGFTALGVWQVERRAWKHALVAQVDARLTAPPVAAPGPAQWAGLAASDAYRRVRVSGRWAGRDTLVQASTRLGPGWWVLTPLRTDAGYLLLVNRGFVATRGPVTRGPARVTGLLRLTEPGGGFLRSNDPAAGRWYSRDVAAIAAAQGLGQGPGQGLGPVAPYFIDADAASSVKDGPTGGLTVVRFPDNHLAYALTWFGLALLTPVGFALIFADHRRSKRLLTPAG